MKHLFICALAVASAASFANVINFDDLASGSVLSNQYAGQGVTFTANAFAGTNPYSNGAYFGTWATDTDMTVSNDPGETPMGTTAADGNVLHTFDGWLGEDGDASFRVSFATAVSSVSLDFIGDFADSNVASRLIAYNSSNTVLADTAISQLDGLHKTISISGVGNISSLGVVEGGYDEFVAVDNLTFTPVPEPASMAVLGVGALALLRKRRMA